MNPIISIIKSITITLLISTVLGFLFIESFWHIFALATALQFIIFYIVNTGKDIAMQHILNKRIAEYSKQSMYLECPCSFKHREIVPIYLDQKNEYNCEQCNKPISVMIEATTLAATVPTTDTAPDTVAEIYNKIAKEMREKEEAEQVEEAAKPRKRRSKKDEQ